MKFANDVKHKLPLNSFLYFFFFDLLLIELIQISEQNDTETTDKEDASSKTKEKNFVLHNREELLNQIEALSFGRPKNYH